jgi:translation initiation factor 4A
MPRFYANKSKQVDNKKVSDDDSSRSSSSGSNDSKCSSPTNSSGNTTVSCEKPVLTNEDYKNMSFDSWEDDEINLNPKLLRGIYSHGFEKPSPIQSKSIIPMCNKKDIIAQAQSGTGKTGAFLVGSLNVLDVKEKNTQVIIISPTRELALQSYDVCIKLSTYMKCKTKLLIGGTSTNDDKTDLLENVPHIVIGTPGRIQDMLRRGHLDARHLKMIVIDEADEMLSVGFSEQIYNIFKHLHNNVQIALFSATMPPEARALTDKIMRDPVEILVKSEMLTLEGIQQYYIAIEYSTLDDDHIKYQIIKDIFQSVSLTQCIIYCNSVKRVQNLTDAMNQDGFPVICIHGSMDDKERRDAFSSFKSGKKRVLVSSDITARGIDVQQLSLVINFDVPKSIHTYLHRIGRSGRWGRKGMAVNFVTKRDLSKIQEIEKWYQTQIMEFPSDFAEKMKFM